jgi:hypothetical protein
MKLEHQHLLFVLKSSGDLTGMRKYGYEYDQILIFLKDLIAQGLVLRTAESIELTEEGLEELEGLKTKEKKTNSKDFSQWILPDYKNKLNNKNTLSKIYIPNQVSLNRICKKVKEIS